ncbi:phage protein [Heyndrickxia sporothermodurans]|uniref:phage protein n=1 Tax=Heyndrickxia sporothermodurans TaxID=46224 RepID=UPI00192B0325|nr:hypothetical protein [Heyndrickxia sporothermodurans]MBL5796775.1 hypothetical protein [Heyndrickxia sporothermodurans]MBL5832122.1 hypothetical protein [Heyndrickxia sporothermodurans]
MTTSPLLFGRVIKISIEASGGKLNFNNDDLEIHFEVPFDDDAKPNISTVQIYNLTKTTINRIKKGANITVSAGYKSDHGVLTSGKVTKVLTKYEGVDKCTTITFKEGIDYSGIKVTSNVADPAEKYYVKKRVKLKRPIKTTTIGKNGRKYTRTTQYKTIKVAKYRKQTMQITFKNGVTARQLITRLTKILGIKLAECNLPKNKIYKKGFKVTGSIENKLEQVVKDCGASMYWRRGKMVIRSIETGNDERFTLQESTGLIEPPEQFEDDDHSGYNVRCLLQHRITTASIIQIKSSTANGKFRAKSGKHYYDGNDFLTEFEVI